MGVLHVGQKIEEQADFEKIYKNGVFVLLEIPLVDTILLLGTVNKARKLIIFLFFFSQRGQTMPMLVLNSTQEPEHWKPTSPGIHPRLLSEYVQLCTSTAVTFTFDLRTGKRTHWGLVMDGWNSMIRYYKNNFSDGFRQVRMNSWSLCLSIRLHWILSSWLCPQDSIDLFLGNYTVDETDGLTPLHMQKDWKFLLVSAFPILLVVWENPN